MVSYSICLSLSSLASEYNKKDADSDIGNKLMVTVGRWKLGGNNGVGNWWVQAINVRTYKTEYSQYFITRMEYILALKIVNDCIVHL